MLLLSRIRFCGPLLFFCWLLRASLAAPVNSSSPASQTNSTLCEWTSPNQFVDQVLQQQLNVTDIVLRCANSCDIMFGFGNPDISGQGVMISYYLQVGIVGICSLILPIAVFFTSKSAWVQRTLGPAAKILRKCQSTVNEINAFFSASIFIAAVVRFRQTPSIFETAFIYYLLYVQSYVLFTVIIFRHFDSWVNAVPVPRSYQFYDVANIFAQLVTSYTFSIRHDAFPVFFAVCKSCSNFYQYQDESAFFAEDQDAGNTAKRWGIAIGISIAFFVAGIVLSYFFKSIRKIFPKWLRKHSMHILFFLTALEYVALFALLAKNLSHLRDVLSSHGGNGEGDDWGYGQTTAVLLWIPVLRTALKAGWELWRPTTPQQEPPENVGAELQAVPSQADAAVVVQEPPPAYHPPSLNVHSDDTTLPRPVILEGSSAAGSQTSSQSRTLPAIAPQETPDTPIPATTILPATEGDSGDNPSAARTSSWDVQGQQRSGDTQELRRRAAGN